MRNKEQRYCNGDKTGIYTQFPSNELMAQVTAVPSELTPQMLGSEAASIYHRSA